MEEKLKPNTTQTPNVIYDLIIPRIPAAEARCLLYITRRTFGFHKKEDRISFSQFIGGITDKDGKKLDYGTGLSRPSVNEALKHLIGAEVVIVRKDTRGNFYELNLNLDPDKVVNKVNQLSKLTDIGKQSKPKQVKLFNLQKKGNKGNKVDAAGKPSAHRQFIDFFYETAQLTRNVKPFITGKDGRNLKRVLDMAILSQGQLEQLATYFLAHPAFKKFSPSITTFLSAGILTGLMNRMRNDSEFWKELDIFARRYIPSVLATGVNTSEMVVRLVELKAKLFKELFTPQQRAAMSEEVAARERAVK